MAKLFFNNEVRNVIVGFMIDDKSRTPKELEESALEFADPHDVPSSFTFLDYCDGLAREGIIDGDTGLPGCFDSKRPLVDRHKFQSNPLTSMVYRNVARAAVKFAVEHGRSMFELLGKGGAVNGSSSSVRTRSIALSELLAAPSTCAEIARRNGLPRNSLACNLEQMAQAGVVVNPGERLYHSVFRLVKSPEPFFAEKYRTWQRTHEKSHIIADLLAASADRFRPGGKHEVFTVADLQEISSECTTTPLKQWVRKLVGAGYAVPVKTAYKSVSRELSPFGRELALAVADICSAMENNDSASELGVKMHSVFCDRGRTREYCCEALRIYSGVSIYHRQGTGDEIRKRLVQIADENVTFTAHEAFEAIGSKKSTINGILDGMVREKTLGKTLVGKKNHYYLTTA